MEISESEVRKFLRSFLEKMRIWDVVFLDDRGKNIQTLSDLELRPDDRKKILMNLKVEDFSQGPIDEQWHGGSTMWVFGKQLKDKEIYIKVTMGVKGTSVICISFHIAEHTMSYPFKTK